MVVCRRGIRSKGGFSRNFFARTPADRLGNLSYELAQAPLAVRKRGQYIIIPLARTRAVRGPQHLNRIANGR